nr:unnamed protein product [Callosobruchus chinensis]
MESFYPEQTANPFLIRTWSPSSVSERLPILVVAQQKRQVSAWTVPLVVEPQRSKEEIYKENKKIGNTGVQSDYWSTTLFHNVSRIMCHDFMSEIISGEFSTLPLMTAQSFVVGLSTSSPTAVQVKVELEEQKHFFLQPDTSYTLTVSPSQPKYAFYKFTEKTSDTVVVAVESGDDVCLTMSVQDAKCPVFDMYKDIKYEGVYQTINIKGAVTIRPSGGFFVVLVAHPDDSECGQSHSALPSPLTAREKPYVDVNIETKVTILVRDGLGWKGYAKASWGTLGVLLLLAALLLGIQMVLNRHAIVSDYYQNMDVHQVCSLLKENRPTLSLLARHPHKIKKRSYNYLSHTLSIALFYSIPVVQLVVTYQRIVNITGNEDMCYYNFRCAHPAFGLSDFNHVFSNIGYVVFGIVFILVVVDRHRIIQFRKDRGIPVHYGLFHAMGVALIIEGLLSACYHICPSQSNYQFDTSFMYIITVLIMIKLYQNRHPDINASAYTTFTILGVVIFMATVGILNGSLSIWVAFVVGYSALCVAVSLKIYYLNYVLDGLRQCKEIIQEKGISSNAFMPVRKARFCLLLVANLVNYGMLVTGLCLYQRNVTDFGTFLLGLLMANAVIQAIFYTSMKLNAGESVCPEATIYGLLGAATWITAGYFFIDFATLWTVLAYFPERAAKWAVQVNKHRDNLFNYIVFLRITPFLPNWFINLSAPVIGVPLFPFAFGTLVGVAPPSFIAIQAGQTLNDMTVNDSAFNTKSFMWLALFSVVSLVPIFLKNRFRQKLD